MSMITQVKLPKYVTVAQAILSEIESGKYPENTVLPPERKLAERFKVSSIVVNKALNLLHTENRIEKIQGKGNFVRSTGSVGNQEKTQITIESAIYPSEVRERKDEMLGLLGGKFPENDFDVKIDAISDLELNPDKDSDIYVVSDFQYPDLCQARMLLPLGVANAKPKSLERCFPQIANYSKFDRHYYGMPFNYNAVGLYCNNTLLDDYKLKTGKLSWQDFMDICREIKKKDPELIPLGFFNFPGCWWENLFATHGLEIIRKDAYGTEVFSPEGRKIIQMIREMLAEGLAIDLTARGIENVREMFHENRVAFTIGGIRFRKMLELDENWKIRELPYKTCNTSMAHGFLFCINRQTHNQDACRNIISFLASEKFQSWVGQENSSCPAQAAAAETTLKEVPNLFEITRKSTVLPAIPGKGKIWDVIDNGLRRIFNNYEIIDDVAEEIDELLYQKSRWRMAVLMGSF